MLSKRIFAELAPVLDGFPGLPLENYRYFRAMLILQEQIMRASEDLLELASYHHPYLAEHVAEEKGHHQWIVEDLLHLDIVASRQPVNPVVAQLVGAQYYHLTCGEPFAFFGYLAFLEGYPAGTQTIEKLRKAFPRSTRTVEYHAQHDVEHRAELCLVLDQLDEKHHDAIVQNALETAELYKTALWRIMVQEKDHG